MKINRFCEWIAWLILAEHCNSYTRVNIYCLAEHCNSYTRVNIYCLAEHSIFTRWRFCAKTWWVLDDVIAPLSTPPTSVVSVVGMISLWWGMDDHKRVILLTIVILTSNMQVWPPVVTQLLCTLIFIKNHKRRPVETMILSWNILITALETGFADRQINARLILYIIDYHDWI